MQMSYRLKVRPTPKDEWTILPGISYATQEEAEQARDFGMAILGGQAEVVHEEHEGPATHVFKHARVQKAG